MPTPATHRGIVVGVDGSPASNVAVDWAARDAAMRKIPLTVVNVLYPPTAGHTPLVSTFYRQWLKDEGRKVLTDALRTVEDSTKRIGPLDVSGELMTGPPVPTLVDVSKDAEMLVVGSHGRGAMDRILLGSVSTGLVHHAHCPVAVIHSQDPLVPDPAQAPVLVGIDGSPASESATAIAFDEASWRGVELVALHAWSDTEVFEFPGLDWSTAQSQGEELLAERLAGWQETLSRRHGAPRRRGRSAGCSAGRAVRIRPAGRRRQPRPRRVHRNAAGFGQHRGGPHRPGARDRRPPTLGRRETWHENYATIDTSR